MLSRCLRIIFIGVFLSVAILAASGLSSFNAAQAQMTVRPDVGHPLNEARALADKGNYSAALAKVKEADGTANKTSAENQAIGQMRDYIAVKSGNFSGNVNSGADAKNKVIIDYRNRRYREVINSADLLRKYNAYDFQMQLLIAQSYYQLGDHNSAIRMLQGMGSSAQVLELLMAAANRAGKTDIEQAAAANLIAQGQSKHWPYLLKAAERTAGLTRDQRVHISRVRFLTGQTKTPEDYFLYAELALQLNFPQEALVAVQKGIKDKVLTGDRANRLLKLATEQAQARLGALPRELSIAKASPYGDPSVKPSETLWGYGRYEQAGQLMQAAFKKQMSDADRAQIVSGIVQLGKGDVSAAMRAFNSVKGAKQQPISRLWSVFARSGSAGKVRELLGVSQAPAIAAMDISKVTNGANGKAANGKANGKH